MICETRHSRHKLELVGFKNGVRLSLEPLRADGFWWAGRVSLSLVWVDLAYFFKK